MQGLQLKNYVRFKTNNKLNVCAIFAVNGGALKAVSIGDSVYLRGINFS